MVVGSVVVLNPSMKASAKKAAPSPSVHRGGPLGELGDVRQRILLASRALIEEEGLSALSMREVARRAGVSHQAPYNHFADREAILGALAEEGFEILRDQLAAGCGDENGDPMARLRGCFRAYVAFACSYPAHFRLMFRPELVDLDRCPGAMAACDRAFEYLMQGVRETVAAGLPAEPSEDAVMAVVWSAAHGLACLLLDGPLAKRLPNAQRDVLIDGVSASFFNLLVARTQLAQLGVSLDPKLSPPAQKPRTASKPQKPRTARKTAARAR
jgi:AcrR family transcriptional regulator